MRPIDPRLIARIGPARRYIVVTAGLGLITAVLLLLQSLTLARMLAPAFAPEALDTDGLGWWGWIVPESARDVSVGLAWLAGIVAARVAVSWLSERLAHRAGTRVVSELREQVVDRAATRGPRWAASGRGADVTTLVTRGLDNLLPYFTRYLPQLMLAATVTPLMLVVVLGLDWLSAAIVLVTLPLVPLFMVLVGLLTRERSARHLEAMQRLGSQTLDLIAGIPTLRGLGRERGPGARVRALGEAHRAATMGSLRIAFLSGMVLELLTTLAVALVAVTMGFRLIDGNIGIETALAVLILAPEAYLPLRNVGTHFHASADGLAAADEAFTVLEEPADSEERDRPAAPPFADSSLLVTGLAVLTPDGRRAAPHDLTLEVSAGRVIALAGPNGDGKSTALMVLAGLIPPSAGAVQTAGGSDPKPLAANGVVAVDPETWSTQVAWVPQRPDLGPAGRTLSLGQRQRRALDRAFDSERPVLLLDEPTAHLDRDTAARVIARIRAAAADGAAVVIATHEPAVLLAADEVVVVRGAAIEDAP